MKRTMKKILVFLAAGLVAVSCIINIGGIGAVSVGSCTEEGIDYTEIREVGAFDAISHSLPCKLYFSQADKQEVRVESTEEFAGKVITEVENGTLTLKMEDGRYPKLILRVVITSPDIESLQTHGSGDIVHEGSLRVKGDLSVKTHGSGDIRLSEVTVDGNMELKSTGSGDMSVKGSCHDVVASTPGSGDISGNLSFGHIDARSSGSGRVRL